MSSRTGRGAPSDLSRQRRRWERPRLRLGRELAPPAGARRRSARPGRGEPSDLRRQRRRWERQLLLLVLLTLVVVGGGVIALVYGPQALLGALPCLGAGAGAIVLLYAFFALAERLVR